MELILFAMISLIVIVALLASRLNDNSFPFPFESKALLFTPAEKNFQKLVEQAMGSKYRVLNRVKLADILMIRNGVSQRASQTALKNAANKYLDFVLCDSETMTLLGAIDLVDTQGKGYKVKKDWFVSGALEAASIPHVRIKVKASYTPDEIKACINNRILGNRSPAPKMKGKVIPAPMIKARSKNVGAIPAPTPTQSALARVANKARKQPKLAQQVPSAIANQPALSH